MERKEALKWLKISEEIALNNNQIFNCPLDNTHALSYEIIPFKEYNKIEIRLKCTACEKNYIITKEIT